MPNPLPSLIVAVVVFISTGIDDIIVLTVFFADPAMRTGSIILGQFIGSSTLVLLSVASGLLALKIPPTWIALLGVLPLCLGIRAFVRLWKHRAADPAATAERERRLQSKTHSQVLAVALVAIAHGADNLGVYVPFFAKSPGMIPWYVLIFTLLTAVSCLIGYKLVKNRLLGDKITRYGRLVIPFILTGLGLNILSGAWPLIAR